MKSYRVSKYNPRLRVDNKYLIDEWTSYTDIGKTFSKKTFTLAEYETVEQNYIDCIIEIVLTSLTKEFKICSLEKHAHIKWKNNQILTLDLLQDFIRDCLREKCWAKLENQNLFVHFGYDYYVYIGTRLEYGLVKDIVQKHKLYAEQFSSPYLD